MITFDLSQAIAGCERSQRRLAAISYVLDHAGDLMKHWERLVEEGNRRGFLIDQTDKNGDSLLAVTYRPTMAQKRAIYAGTAKPVKLTESQRLGQNLRKKRGDFYGIGQHQSGLNNNLTPREYRELDGPPTAPRKQFSRAITNFETSSWQAEEHGHWVVKGEWREVVSVTGYHFLPDLFDGNPPQPGPRDLRGIRPDDLVKIRAMILPWAKLKVRELWQGTE